MRIHPDEAHAGELEQLQQTFDRAEPSLRYESASGRVVPTGLRLSLWP